MLQESLGADNDYDGKDPIEKKLCEQCAMVMKQQQLTPSSFLARFFDVTVLSQHAADVLQKSGKGSAPILAERIAGEWAKNKGFHLVATMTPKADHQEQGMAPIKTESSKTNVVAKKATKAASAKRKASNKDAFADHSEQEAENELSVPSKQTLSTSATATVPKKTKTTKKLDNGCV
jgi:hypothetical protein